MLLLLLKLLWLVAPAGLANIAPVIFRGVDFLDIPIDFNRKLNGKPIFGRNKTFRGFFFGISLAIIAVYIQKLLYPYTASFCILDYEQNNFVILGLILGFGALLGDAIKSFFKRRWGIAAGSSWIPFDQLDWIVGAMVLLRIYTYIPISHMLLAIVIFALIHPVFNYVSYLIGLQENKY